MTTQSNPLLTTLKIIEILSLTELTTEKLTETFEISPATLNRHIAEARSMGAKIESVRINRKSIYRLTNTSEVMVRVLRWIDLEKKRNLIEI